MEYAQEKLGDWVYINTVEQVFDEFGLNAEYSSRKFEDKITITISKVWKCFT